MDPRPVPAAWEWPSMREAYLGLADRYRAELAQALTLLGDAEPPAADPLCRRPRPDGHRVRDGALARRRRARSDRRRPRAERRELGAVQRSASWLAQAADERANERGGTASLSRAGRTLVDVLEEIEEREGIRNLLVGAGADEPALDRLVGRLRGEA